MATFKDIFRDEATKEGFNNLPAFEKEKVFNLLAEEDEGYKKLPEVEKIKFRKILLTPEAEPDDPSIITTDPIVKPEIESTPEVAPEKPFAPEAESTIQIANPNKGLLYGDSVAYKETDNVANYDDSGILGNTIGFGKWFYNFTKHTAIGAAKGVEEIGETFGVLEDDAFNLSKPQTTAEGLAQGIGQFMPAFIPAAGAIGWGVRAAGLVGKTKKVKMAVDFLIGATAGAVSDFISFDPKEPNVANFLLVSGAISKDSRAAEAVKALLAQDDSDPEVVARLKNATTGVIAGAILTGLFKGAGYAFKRVKGKGVELDGVPIEEVEDIARKEAENYTTGVLKSKQELIDEAYIDDPTTYTLSEAYKKKGGDVDVDDVGVTAEVKPKPSEPQKDPAVKSEENIEVDISDIETPIEAKLGVEKKVKTEVVYAAKPLLEKAAKAKLDKDVDLDTEALPSRISPATYKLSEAAKKKGGQELIDKGQELNKFLTKTKLKNKFIEQAWDDDKYLATIIEGIDGKPASAEAIALLKNAAGNDFRSQLVTGTGAKAVKQSRKHATADLRDPLLAKFGLRTKRSFIDSMVANIELTKKLASEKAGRDYLRKVAKSPKRNEAIREVYDPSEVSKFRDLQRFQLAKLKEGILNKLRKSKAITDAEFKQLKAKDRLRLKEETKVLKEDINTSQKEIDEFIQDFKSDIELLDVEKRVIKKDLTAQATKKIEAAKRLMNGRLNKFYGKITQEKGKLRDQGWYDLGGGNSIANDIPVIEGSPLRGIMVKKTDFNAMRELLSVRQPSSLEDISKLLKFLQATADLFQLPQFLRSAIETTGVIRGTYNWLKSVAMVGKDVTVDDIIDTSQWSQIGRFKEQDIVLDNQFRNSMNDTPSEIIKILRKFNKATDVAGLREIKSVLSKFKALEHYQFQTVGVALKVRSFKTMVARLQKRFPDKPLREIKVEAGRALDDYFGGQDWNKVLARNPKLARRSFQSAARTTIFATDYLLSRTKVAKREGIDVFGGGIKGKIARDAFIRKTVTGLGTINALSFLLNGHSTFQNDDPEQWYKVQINAIKDKKGNPLYIDLMGNWGQAANFISRPVPHVANKLGGIPRVLVSTFKGFGGSGIQFEGLTPIPFSLRQMQEYIFNEMVGGKSPKFGQTSSLKDAALLSAINFLGVQSTFATKGSKSASIANLIREGVFDEPANYWNYLIGKNIPTKKKTPQVKKRRRPKGRGR